MRFTFFLVIAGREIIEQMKLLKLIASPVFLDSIRDYGYNKMSEQYQFLLDPVFGSLHSNTK